MRSCEPFLPSTVALQNLLGVFVVDGDIITEKSSALNVLFSVMSPSVTAVAPLPLETGRFIAMKSILPAAATGAASSASPVLTTYIKSRPLLSEPPALSMRLVDALFSSNSSISISCQFTVFVWRSNFLSPALILRVQSGSLLASKSTACILYLPLGKVSLPNRYQRHNLNRRNCYGL